MEVHGCVWIHDIAWYGDQGRIQGGNAGPPLLPLLARGLRETTQSAASLGCLTYARS